MCNFSREGIEIKGLFHDGIVDCFAKGEKREEARGNCYGQFEAKGLISPTAYAYGNYNTVAGRGEDFIVLYPVGGKNVGYKLTRGDAHSMSVFKLI